MRQRDDGKEKRIREAVIRLVLTEGFAGASIAKIAREAEVSPATVYIYYENKEEMLKDIYLAYSDEMYQRLRAAVHVGTDAADALEALMRGYYDYVTGHREAFSFIEQFAGCPSMVARCAARKGICQVYGLMEEMKAQRLLPPFSDANLAAMIFYPVKAILLDHEEDSREKEGRLTELIGMVQGLLRL